MRDTGIVNFEFVDFRITASAAAEAAAEAAVAAAAAAAGCIAWPLSAISNRLDVPLELPKVTSTYVLSYTSTPVGDQELVGKGMGVNKGQLLGKVAYIASSRVE